MKLTCTGTQVDLKLVLIKLCEKWKYVSHAKIYVFMFDVEHQFSKGNRSDAI